jgi:3-hydroxyacyl-[acyl-carrier-protein] dehydratase
MTSVQHTAATPSGDPSAKAGRPPLRTLFDLSGIDLSARIADRAEIARINPHRGSMALLDWIVWHTPDCTRIVGLKHVGPDEFWVPGHFPEKAMFPGVLMIEVGAQVACYAYNSRRHEPNVCAFLRIEHAAFRAMVQPGDDLYVLAQEVKFGRRHFECDLQGMVNGRVAFDARISGMSIPPT